MYRGRFLLFPGRRRVTEFLCGGFFFIEGAHLGFLQFVERQLFLFFPTRVLEREKEISFLENPPQHKREERKKARKRNAQNTQRERHREKEVRVCV